LSLKFLTGDKVKITKYLTVIAALCILGWTSACNQNTETKNVNQPATNSATNVNQTPAVRTEATKTESNNPVAVSLSTPSDAYKAAYNARQKKDLAALKKVMSKDALEFFTMMGDEKSPDEGLKQLIERPQAATAETRSEKINGDKATLEYLNEKGAWGTMDFVKEDGDWKLTIPKPDTKGEVEKKKP
jgi:hypothetical protein